MRLPRDLVGTTVGPRVHEIDARWLMAYAAALGATDAEYLDTGRPGGLLAHPLFPVCYEWPLAVEMRAALPAAVALRSVHATHDLRLHRRPRVGDRLATRATVLRVERRRSGAYVLTRFQTVDADGAPVTETDYGSVYLGVAAEPAGPPGDAPGADRGPGAPPGATAWSAPVAVAATLAHVYSECARIWNPIHTDRAVARAAGLADIILHGTATLALAVSEVLAREPGGPAAAVTRVAGRFGAMVPMPSTLVVEGQTAVETPGARRLAFQARVAGDRPALRDGTVWITLSPATGAPA